MYMKVQKLIMLDYELMEKLRNEPSASKLINTLLLGHYEGKSLEKMSEQEIDKMIRLEELKKKHTEELKEAENA